MESNTDAAAAAAAVVAAFRDTHDGETPLGWAIRESDLCRVIELVEEEGHNVNGCDNSSDSPLHNLFFLKDADGGYEIACYLLDNGAKLHVQDWLQATPIGTCVLSRRFNVHDNFRICQLLFSHGVESDSQGLNPTGITTVNQLLCNHQMATIDPTLLRRLLDSLGRDLRPFLTMKNTIDGSCSLHHVLNVDVAQCLVEYGYDPASTSGVESTWTSPIIFSIRDTEGETPFDAARAYSKHIKS